MYLEAKADNPGSLLLYQVGDFFEAYADDAEVVGTALDLTQTTRAVDHNTRVPMVGFPQLSFGNLSYNADRQRVRCCGQLFGER